MALTGRRVILLWALAAALVALALLPPTPDWWDDRYRQVTDTPTRAQQLERLVRRTEGRLRLLTLRDRATAELTRRPDAAGASSPTLVVDAALTAPQRRAVADAWAVVVAGLGPAAGGTRAGMLVVAHDAPEATLHLLPDAPEGGTCVVAVDLGRWRQSSSAMSHILRRALGPCAYYHAFGPPGPHIRAWLGRAGLRPALEADWDGTDRKVGFRRATPPLVPEGRSLGLTVSAVWERPYLGTLEQTACAAGHRAACATALEAPEGPLARARRWPAAEARGLFIRPGSLGPWWGFEAQYFLADLVREQGRERFTRFWRSPLSVDGAFAATYGIPLDRYISEWLRGGRTIGLGPTIRTSSVLLSLLFAILVVGAGALFTTRRQVT